MEQLINTVWWHCVALKGILELMQQCQHYTKLKINTLQCNDGAAVPSNLANTTAFTIQTGVSATKQAYTGKTWVVDNQVSLRSST